MLADFCISSLVIICFVKSFYDNELNENVIRFFGPAVSRVRSGALPTGTLFSSELYYPLV